MKINKEVNGIFIPTIIRRYPGTYRMAVCLIRIEYPRNNPDSAINV
jgi:hypothetical protein